GPASRCESDIARLEHVARHYTELRFPCGDYSRSVGTNDSRPTVSCILDENHRVSCWDHFCYYHDRAQAGVDRLHPGLLGEWGGDEDYGSVRIRLFEC